MRNFKTCRTEITRKWFRGQLHDELQPGLKFAMQSAHTVLRRNNTEVSWSWWLKTPWRGKWLHQNSSLRIGSPLGHTRARRSRVLADHLRVWPKGEPARRLPKQEWSCCLFPNQETYYYYFAYIFSPLQGNFSVETSSVKPWFNFIYSLPTNQ